MDVATCLDLSLPEQVEAKFLALKALHAKKTKQLMQSIESKEKDIAKLKVLSKDSRRTQMIQALRDKIRSMELVMDVVKAELGKSEHPSRGKMSAEAVNEFVIEKTVAGPKRFRPLTREELENKITALEKSLLARPAGGGRGSSGALESKSVAGSVTGGSRAPSVAGSVSSRTQPVSARSESKDGGGDDDGDGGGGGGGGGGGSSAAAANNNGNGGSSERDTARIVQLMEEVEARRMALDVAEGSVELQKEEASRLRERNAELVAGEEESDFATRQYRELRASYDAMQDELDATTRRLTEALEENMALRGETDVVSEQRAMELDALHDQCERLLNQNSQLLERLGEMEVELDGAFQDRARAGTASASAEAGEQAKAQALATAERKAAKLQEKLRAAEARVSELASEAQQIPALTDQLREKNGLIRELTRRLEERGSSPSPDARRRTGSVDNNSQGSTSPSKTGAGAGAGAGAGTGAGAGSAAAAAAAEAESSRLRAQLAESREEVRQLKQALAVAALGPGPSASSKAARDDLYPQVVKAQSAVLAALIDHVSSASASASAGGSKHAAVVASGCEKLFKMLGAMEAEPEGQRTLVDAHKLQQLLAALDPSESKS